MSDTILLVGCGKMGGALLHGWLRRGVDNARIYVVDPADESRQLIHELNIFYAVNEEVKTLNCKKESKKGCNNKSVKCITHNLWDKLDSHINGFFENVKLEEIVKR